MGTDDRTLVSAEYATLRDEMLRNKQYVFERPLLIATAAGIAAVELSGEASVVLLPLLVSFVLLTNLWFTTNRLRSNARIAAYVGAVLEPSSDLEWIGWETSLREYRLWQKRTPPEQQQEQKAPYIDEDAIPDAMMFYSALLVLHAGIAVIALGASVCSVCSGPTALSVSALVLTAVVAAFFASFCLRQGHPRKISRLIEESRAIWMVVLK